MCERSELDEQCGHGGVEYGCMFTHDQHHLYGKRQLWKCDADHGRVHDRGYGWTGDHHGCNKRKFRVSGKRPGCEYGLYSMADGQLPPRRASDMCERSELDEQCGHGGVEYGCMFTHD